MHEEARVKANLSEGGTTAGGFLVPEEFAAEVLRLAPLYGVIRANCRIIPMKYDIINIPAAGTTDQSAMWTNEAAQILQTNPTFRQCVLTINKLAAIPKVTNELLADASVDVVQYLAELIAEAFAKEEDNQGFNGTGSPFVGVLNATGAPTFPHAGGTAFICLSYPDLVNATAEIYDNALGNAKFYFHRSMIAHIRSLITTAGAPIFGNTAKDLAGYPLVSVEVLPGRNASTAKTDATLYAIFGDLRKGFAMGERGTITMKISDQATVASDNLFEKDMVALRMIERIAQAVLLPSSFVQILS
jgi:HK97 family phage major capsid protein